MRPHFKYEPNLFFLLGTTFALPLIYLICLWLTRNHVIAVFQFSLLFLPAILLLKKCELHHAFNRKDLGKNTLLTLIATLVVTTSLNLALNSFLPHIPGNEEMQDTIKTLFTLNSPVGLVLDMFSVAVVPAICEEVFFRGWVQTGLSHTVKPNAAIALTATFFALFHTNLWLFPFYFSLAVVFGCIYYKTRNLGLAILAHFVNNAVGVGLFHWMQ